MKPLRLLLPALAVLLTLSSSPAIATVGPPIKLRWSGEWPAPARAGFETVGRIELSVVRPGIIEDFAIGGAGWTIRGVDASGRLVLPAGVRRVITFRAVPTDPAAPIVITGTIGGLPFRKEFRLDAARLGRIGKPGAVRATSAPTLSGTGPGAITQGGGRNIRFRGRFMYERQGGGLVGGDNIVVRIMDDDAPGGDEEIGRFLTDPEGEYDQTLYWDDCDIVGCDDPDIYVIYEAANLVVEVRSDDSEEMYTWSTEAAAITDFTGSDVDFGLHIADSSPQAVHIYNGIVRAHRYALLNGAMNGAHTFCHWPATTTTGAFYSETSNEIHIGSGEEWTEGTIVHEYGHRLAEQFSVLDPPTYDTGFCDTPTPGHCVWCPENPKDAWQEGFANWFADWALRLWAGEYDDIPLSQNDNRYNLEFSQSCSPGQFFPSASTEGYVGMLLRDIEDVENEDADGELPDCDMDVLGMGASTVFWIFRDGDPATVFDFINGFRTLFGFRDPDLWATIQNVAPAMNFPEPVVSLVQDAEPCRIVRVGETVHLNVAGAGALDRYQWRRNRSDLADDAVFQGTRTGHLVITDIRSNLDGDYACFVLTCNGSSALTSRATHVRFGIPNTPSTVVSWGENGAAQVGNGATSPSAPPYNQPNLADAVAVDGGRSYSMLLRNDGRLFTWGNEQWGELGNGAQPSGQVNAPVQIASDIVRIAAGKYFGLALHRDGRIRGWGWNLQGQLFTGDRHQRVSPDTTLFFGCVKDIAAGDEHSLALMEDGTVWAVGYNEYGALGQGTIGGFSLTPVQVPGLTNVIDIDAAGVWSMALRADSTVWTWGINSWGQLGLGHYGAVATPTQVPGLTSIKQISAGQDNMYALRSDGRAWATGYGPSIGIGWTGGSSNIPQPLGLTNITQIAGGASWAMAVIDGRLKGWGLNGGGFPPEYLGILNNAGPYTQGTPVDIPGVYDVTRVWAGWVTAHAFGRAGTVDVTPPDDRPAVLALAAAPNPAREATTIRFDLPTAGRATLAVYDVSGRVVRTLAREDFPAGRHARLWDGSTNAGARAAAGVYFVRLSAPGGSLHRTLVRAE